MVEKGKKFVFLVVVLGKHKCGAVVGNLVVAWKHASKPQRLQWIHSGQRLIVWLKQRWEKNMPKKSSSMKNFWVLKKVSKPYSSRPSKNPTWKNLTCTILILIFSCTVILMSWIYVAFWVVSWKLGLHDVKTSFYLVGLTLSSSSWINLLKCIHKLYQCNVFLQLLGLFDHILGLNPL